MHLLLHLVARLHLWLALGLPLSSIAEERTTWELLVELLLGQERAATLAELGQRWGGLALLVGVIALLLTLFWKPLLEWLQQAFKQKLPQSQPPSPPSPDAEQLRQATTCYLERLQQDLARTTAIPIKNMLGSLPTSDYVPLQVAPRGAPPTAAEPIFAALIVQSPPPGLLLLGVAGSGKSHSLRFAALRLAQRWPSIPPQLVALGLRERDSLLPIYVRLQAWPACVAHLQQADPQQRKPSFLAALDALVYAQIKGDRDPADTPLRRFVSAHLAAENERCLLLLDGFDELPEQDRHTVQKELRQLQQREPRHRYVVTARPLADQEFTAYGFVERHLLPLQPAQIAQLWHNCWQAWGPGGAPTAQQEALLLQVQADPDLQPLVTNPLMLSAIARLATERVGLPQRRAAKLQRMVELLLSWRRNRLGAAAPLPEEHDATLLDSLGRFAFAMLVANTEQLTLEAYHSGHCWADLDPPPDPADRPTRAELYQDVQTVVLHTGLLRETQEGRYQFCFGFRDYLAAYWLANQQTYFGHFYARRADPAWRNILIFALSYATDTLRDYASVIKVVQDLRASEEPAAILLAAEALVEVNAGAGGWARKLETLRTPMLASLHALAQNATEADQAAQAQAWLNVLEERA
ncbi:MAG: NACHT domain-containing protein [Candidatus Viridilinea halotolerans]|uniref:NACHT domain-containing protein n=1 Tax=Candidatus Viridilinea halotolerans TaxID=2491704 RepID=A0A426TSK4_9CHLR|nr:MAG: NACHT domain-containing protein [Candidatus Viridilinea halotolerans]